MHVYQHTREAQRGAIFVVVNVSVCLDPLLFAVRTAGSILMGISACAGNGLINGPQQTAPIFGMDRRDDLLKTQTLVTQGWIKLKGTGKGFVHGKTVGTQIRLRLQTALDRSFSIHVTLHLTSIPQNVTTTSSRPVRALAGLALGPTPTR